MLVLDLETVPECLPHGGPIAIPSDVWGSVGGARSGRWDVPSDVVEVWDHEHGAGYSVTRPAGATAAQLEEAMSTYLRRALEPRRCRIVAWALADLRIDKPEVIAATRYDDDEASLLRALLAELDCHAPGVTLAAWCGPRFDFPVLRARALVCGLPELARYVAPVLRGGRVCWSHAGQVDLAEFTAERACRGRHVSKASVAEAWGLTIETASGAEVPRWWAAGDHGAVLAHVIEDVQIEHRIGRLQAAHEVSEDGT